MSARRRTSGPIPAWKLVAGIMLHFAPVAWLVGAALAMLIQWRIPTTYDALFEDSIFAGVIAGVWLILTAVAGLVTASASRIARWRAERLQTHGPHADIHRSRRMLEEALPELERLAERLPGPGRDAGRELRRLADRWDHTDPELQRITRDLHAASRTLPDALHAADPDHRDEIGAISVAALVTLSAAARTAIDHAGDRGAEGARTFGRYIAASYGDPLRLT